MEWRRPLTSPNPTHWADHYHEGIQSLDRQENLLHNEVMGALLVKGFALAWSHVV
jgi:hypothetical protein